MDSDHALVLFFALILVGSAVAIAYSYPALLGGGSGGIMNANLASFETSDPFCGDRNTTSGTAISHDIVGGEALVINKTIHVASNDTQITATLDKFGSNRYIVAVSREAPAATATATPTTTATPATTATPTTAATSTTATTTTAKPSPSGTEHAVIETETAQSPTPPTTEATPTEPATPTTEPSPSSTTTAASSCYREIGYNATVQLGQPHSYTVLVTYDGELVNAYWKEGDDTGSFDRLSKGPEPTERVNETGTTTGSPQRG